MAELSGPENSALHYRCNGSANHNGSLDQALRIMDEAKKAGADALKIQTYRPDTITLDCNSEDFMQIKDGLWRGRNLYQLLRMGTHALGMA